MIKQWPLNHGVCFSYLADGLEGICLHVGKDVAIRITDDLKGNSTVVVLQWRNVVVANRQVRTGVNLVPDGEQPYIYLFIMEVFYCFFSNKIMVQVQLFLNLCC